MCLAVSIILCFLVLCVSETKQSRLIYLSDEDIPLCNAIHTDSGTLKTAKTWLGAQQLAQENLDDVDINVDSLTMLALGKLEFLNLCGNILPRDSLG